MPLYARPTAPSPGMLAEARAELSRRASHVAQDSQWRIGKRMDRKRSTVFPLTLVAEDGRPLATAYYKAPYFPDADQRPRRNLGRARTALLQSREFGDRFADLAAGSGVRINTTLALDRDTLEIVTRGVPGRTMGNPVRHLWTGARREAAIEACHRVGQAVRLLDEFEVADPDAERERIWGETERKLRSAPRTLSTDEIGALERRLAQLLDDAFDQERPLTVAHGDLSPSNILMAADSTGIIDFMWAPQLRGFDLARLAHRFRYGALAPRRWTTTLIDAMLHGFGDRTMPEGPGWRFVTLQRALATALRDNRGPRLGSARRALAHVRSAL